VLQEIAGRFAVRDDAVFQRGHEVDLLAVGEGGFAKQHLGVVGDDAFDEAVLGVADNRGHDLAEADVLGAGGLREEAGGVGAQVETDEQGGRGPAGRLGGRGSRSSRFGG